MVRRAVPPLNSVVVTVVDVARYGLISHIKLKLIQELMRWRISAQRDAMLACIQRTPDDQDERDHAHAEIGQGDLRQGVKVHQWSMSVINCDTSLGLRRVRCNAPVFYFHPTSIGGCS